MNKKLFLRKCLLVWTQTVHEKTRRV